METNALVIKNLHVSVGDKPVINDFSLTIKPGEVHVLMGANGTGKSSLTKALAGHNDYRVTNGDIYINGISVREMSADERAREGLFLAFQQPHELEGVSVANFVRTALKSQTRFKTTFSATDYYKQLYRELERVNLSREFTSRSLNQGFSGSEKKRLELLQMIFLRPKYALLDEIDSGMDVDALKLVLSVIEDLKKEAKTGFLFITHHTNLVEELHPDAVHVLSEGSIKLSGQTEILRLLNEKGYEGLKTPNEHVKH